MHIKNVNKKQKRRGRAEHAPCPCFDLGSDIRSYPADDLLCLLVTYTRLNSLRSCKLRFGSMGRGNFKRRGRGGSGGGGHRGGGGNRGGHRGRQQRPKRGGGGQKRRGGFDSSDARPNKSRRLDEDRVPDETPVRRDPSSDSSSEEEQDPYKELLGTMDLNRKPVVVSSEEEEEEDEDAGTEVEDAEQVPEEGEQEEADDSESDGGEQSLDDEEQDEVSEDEISADEEKVWSLIIFSLKVS